MSRHALKLKDFNTEAEASITALTRSLAFDPIKKDDECESCLALKSEAESLKAGFADKHAAEIDQLKLRFENELDALREDLNLNLKTGLGQCLTALFPALADASLRRGLEAEIQRSLASSLPDVLSVSISPCLTDIPVVPSKVVITKDPTLSGYVVEIKQGAARTRLDPEAILNTCLNLLEAETTKGISK